MASFPSPRSVVTSAPSMINHHKGFLTNESCTGENPAGIIRTRLLSALLALVAPLPLPAPDRFDAAATLIPPSCSCVGDTKTPAPEPPGLLLTNTPTGGRPFFHDSLPVAVPSAA